MLKNVMFFVLVSVVATKGISQKVLEKQFDASGFELVAIYSEMISKLTVVTETSNKIHVLTRVNGENYENVVVTATEENQKLILGIGYSPFFIAQNDKLAAHKVISIEMTVTLPESMYIEVETAIANLVGIGKFETFNASLITGNCGLFNFLGDATIKTRDGNVSVNAVNNVSGTAISLTGTVINNLPKYGKYHILAESLSGDISLLQTK